MSGLPIPPNTEPLSTGDRPNDIWWRYWEADSKALNDLTTALGALPVATTFAQTIMATTTASQVRTILGVDASPTVGNWTPGLAIGGTTINSAPSVAAGRYVQFPSGLVQAWGTITATTLGATTGSVTITGLPVRASSTSPGLLFSGAVGSVSGRPTGSTLTGPYSCHVTTGSTVVTMTRYSSGTSVGHIPLNSDDITTAVSISVSVSYETSL